MSRFVQGFVFTGLMAISVSAQTEEEVAAERLTYIADNYGGGPHILRPSAEADNPVAQNIVADDHNEGNGVMPT
ncbi:MAG: hypothetical protein GY717_18535 [Rhodobacteraceae bacterium]|nr:hypothetical protein [Paracoccaceae bacterium]